MVAAVVADTLMVLVALKCTFEPTKAINIFVRLHMLP